jgi:hypothetical protein
LPPNGSAAASSLATASPPEHPAAALITATIALT